MATYHNSRCALCGQFVAASDREVMLQATKWEWSESVVDDARAASVHDCTDRDPYGARESERLIEAGLIGAELRWLIELALERRQAAGRPAWATFTAAAALSAIAPMRSMVCRCVASGSVRDALSRVCGHMPAGEPGRSPP